MQRRQLKRLIETGHYRPQPERVADAMLQRASVRELLTAGVTMGATGQTQSPSTARRQAA